MLVISYGKGDDDVRHFNYIYSSNFVSHLLMSQRLLSFILFIYGLAGLEFEEFLMGGSVFV